MRATIINLGGEVHFDSHVSDLLIEEGALCGVTINGEHRLKGDAVVLATGHSARDIFTLLRNRGVALEAKTYALGVRVEHPQEVIDKIQYRQEVRDPHLPAASYRLAQEGVYSFCMCPGGIIVPAATAPGEIVVNGMSPSKRNSRWANSGVVTQVEVEDLKPYLDEHGPLAGMAFQQHTERAAFAASGDGSQRAPAQRLIDFLLDRESKDLPRISYAPGTVSVRLSRVLPERIYSALRASYNLFGEKMPEFLTTDAVVVGVESRTSSPVRVPRDSDTLSHPEVAGLFPCGEGAGYAGGIVSAAMDGQRVARAVAKFVTRTG